MFGIKKTGIAIDTVKLSTISFVLNGLGLLLNILLTNTLGTAAVGVMTLITTVFGFIIVLANGNIFVSTERFVSEEIGAGNRNFKSIMRFSLTFSLVLSGTFTLFSLFFAEKLAVISGDANIETAIRIMALSLPPAGVGSCIKGFFHAKRQVKFPLIGDVFEFSCRYVILMFGIIVFIPNGVSIYLLISIAMLIAEVSSCVFYIFNYVSEYKIFSKLPENNKRIITVKTYMKLNLPIILSGYVTMTMSALNDVLVPVALLDYHENAEKAMSEYGLFESIIIPVIFYPSFILTSLQTLIIPEIARANSAENHFRVNYLIDKLFRKTLTFALFVSAVLLTEGAELGELLCPSDNLAAKTLRLMFFAIPFIYMEIILEGILRGLGKQGFSTVNSLFEYVIRIGTVIIATRFLGFYGVLLSYYLSNILSNIVRVIKVCSTVKLKFNTLEYIIKPILASSFCVLTAKALSSIIFSGKIFSVAGFLLTASILYLIIIEISDRYFYTEFKFSERNQEILLKSTTA
ncbi:MAG: oligosaccharide flippase family protein [Ruminococcus sp.]|jgi:stage V sporulation protein B|nr:oligosaccharide flippase family protein [Ruminococcus sp.]